MDTTPTLPALPKPEKFFDFWLVTHQLLTSITQGEHELQRYFGSFTNSVPVGFIQQVYAATKTVTANGNAKIDTSQSKFGGASGSFDGTNSYLSTPDSADWNFGTGDFTIDFWMLRSGTPADYTGLIGASNTSNNGWELDLNHGANIDYLRWITNGSGTPAVDITASSAIGTGWNHVAIVRYGNTVTMYLDGSSVGSVTVTGWTINSAGLGVVIGRGFPSYNNYYYNGWIDELRISKGLARWTNNFTPPTAEYASDSYTVLLLHMNGAYGSTTFIDSSGVTGPDFSISASPGSQSIGAGGSALSTLTLTALGGYSGTVGLVSSGCSAAGMSCTLNGNPTTSVTGGSGTVTLVVNTLVNTPPAAYSVVVTATDSVNSAITHQATFTVTVGTATSYLFNVKGTAIQIVVTLTYSWSGSGTPPQGSVIISAPSGTVCNPSCLEAGGAVYDRTSISVSTAGNTYNIIHRVTFTITAPGALPAWTAYVTLSGVNTYTITIEVS